MGDDAEGMTVGEYVKAREARGAFVWRARGTVSGASPRYLYGYRSFVELPLDDNLRLDSATVAHMDYRLGMEDR